MYFITKISGEDKEINTAKGVNIPIEFKEYEDILF